jgi:type IV secretion system protein VirD4
VSWKKPAPPPPKRKGRIARRAEKATAAAARATYKPALVLSAGAVLQAAHTGPWGWLALGSVATWYGREGADAMRVRRSGGKVAARRRRKFQGTATASEIGASLSVRAARRNAKVTRPSLSGRIAAQDAGVRLGEGGRPKRTLMASHEDFILLLGSPRSGKSATEAAWLAEAPGAAISTTTRTDVWVNTAMARAAKGPLWVLNPDGDGDLPTNFRLSPLTGCHIPQIAIESAGYLQHAAPSDKGGKDAHWDQRGAELLRLAMHAAAVAGADMRYVAAWVRNPSDPQFAAALCLPSAADGWAHKLATIRDTAPETLDGIIGAAESAISWMDDPFMASVACPGPRDAGFDALDFLCSSGTLYLIAADKPHGSVAPYCAWMTANIWSNSKRLASRMPGGRLDPPLTMVLDEPAITCPVPIDRWSAEAGGHGVTLITGVQSPAQLAQRWGEHGAKTIRDNATVKLILRGRDDHTELEPLSAMCGERDTWHHVKNPGGSKTRQPAKERVFPPERIRTLKPWQAIVLHRSTRPLIARLTPVWERPGHQKAPLGPALLQAQQAVLSGQPAIEAAPQREAIVTPYAPPAAVTASHDPISPLPPVGDTEAVPADIDIEEIPEWATPAKAPVTSHSAGSTT